MPSFITNDPVSHPSQQLATVGLRPLNSKLPVLLFVGNSEHYEFLPFTEVLRKSGYPFHAVANLLEAIRFLEKTPDLPDLIIIGQLWPEEFSSDDPVVLSQIAPLARFAWCLGSWCPPPATTIGIPSRRCLFHDTQQCKAVT